MYSYRFASIFAQRAKKAVVAMTLALTSSFNLAHAGVPSSTTCAAIDTSNGGTPAAAMGVYITVNPGDVVTANSAAPFDLIPAVGAPAPGLTSVTYTATFSGILQLSGSSSDVVATCVPAPPATTTASVGDTAGEITGNSQTNAIHTSVDRNTANRLRGGQRIGVSQNVFYFQTPSTEFGADWNAWVSGEYRSYDGGIEGHSADIVAGVDRRLGENFLAGFLVGYSDLDLTEGTSFADGKSLAFGPYFGAKLSENLILDGFVTTARPDYTTNNGSFESDRVSFGLSLRGFVENGPVLITPALELRAYSEDQPAYNAIAANKINSRNARASVRFDFTEAFGGNGLVPYFSIGADHGNRSSTARGDSDYTSGRLGLGVSGQAGPGDLTVDVDYGKVRSDVNDLGVRMRYLISF